MKLSLTENRELTRYLGYYDFSRYITGKTFWVTGAKGICGTGVIKWLLKANELHNTNVKIIASTRNPADIPQYIESCDPISFCEFGKEARACSGRKIDFVIHTASPTQNSYFKSNPASALRVIIDGTENALEIATESGSSMIYLSSEEAYGITDSDEPIPESYVGAVDSLNIRSCYPLGKKTAELLCFTYAAEYGTDVKIIRPATIHGLFQKYEEERLANEILRCIIENRNLEMKSAGTSKKCIIYTLDAVSAIFTVLFKGERGQVYNASNPSTFMAAKNLADSMFKKFAPQITVEFSKEDTSVTDGYLPKRALLQDISRLEALSWEPKTELEDIYRIDVQRLGGFK